MEDKKLITKFLIFVFTGLIGLSCSDNNCYKVQVEQNKSKIDKGSPVIFGNGIAGYVEKVESSKDMLTAEFCLPSTIRIPRDSKVYVGFIQAFSVNGIKIEPGMELDFVSNKEALKGISMDSIGVTFQDADTAMTNMLIDIAKEVNDKQKYDSLNNK